MTGFSWISELIQSRPEKGSSRELDVRGCTICSARHQGQYRNAELLLSLYHCSADRDTPQISRLGCWFASDPDALPWQRVPTDRSISGLFASRCEVTIGHRVDAE